MADKILNIVEKLYVNIHFNNDETLLIAFYHSYSATKLVLID